MNDSGEQVQVVQPPKHFGFLLVSDYTMISLSSALAVLRLANRESGRELYRWSVLTLDGQPVFSSAGLQLVPDTSLAGTGNMDILFVCGGVHVERHMDKPLLDALREQGRKKVPLGALCTASYLLAGAGLLDGYRATIHYEHINIFREKFPNVQASSRLFAVDRDRYTCAGGVSATDLMLKIVGEEHGPQLVQSISEMMIYDRVRTEQDAQRAPLHYLIGASQPKLIEAVALMEANIEEPLALDEIATFVGVSRRQLERLFHKYLQCAPSRYYLELRLNRARLLLLQSSMPIIEVAISCGFSTAPHFSKCYSEHYGKPPREERKPREK